MWSLDRPFSDASILRNACSISFAAITPSWMVLPRPSPEHVGCRKVGISGVDTQTREEGSIENNRRRGIAVGQDLRKRRLGGKFLIVSVRVCEEKGCTVKTLLIRQGAPAARSCVKALLTGMTPCGVKLTKIMPAFVFISQNFRGRLILRSTLEEQSLGSIRRTSSGSDSKPLLR